MRRKTNYKQVFQALKRMASGVFPPFFSIRDMEKNIVALEKYVDELEQQMPYADVSEMKTSAGTDYFVTVHTGKKHATDTIADSFGYSIGCHKRKNRAEYEAASFNAFINGLEEPDIFDYPDEVLEDNVHAPKAERVVSIPDHVDIESVQRYVNALADYKGWESWYNTELDQEIGKRCLAPVVLHNMKLAIDNGTFEPSMLKMKNLLETSLVYMHAYKALKKQK